MLLTRYVPSLMLFPMFLTLRSPFVNASSAASTIAATLLLLTMLLLVSTTLYKVCTSFVVMASSLMFLYHVLSPKLCQH